MNIKIFNKCKKNNIINIYMCNCDKKKRCDCEKSLKINTKNDKLSYKNCSINQKLLKNEYYLEMKDISDGYFDCNEVLENGYFSFDGYLSEENKSVSINFGKTGDPNNWEWSFQVTIFFGSSPTYGSELKFTAITLEAEPQYPYTTHYYYFYNVKGFFNYRVLFSNDDDKTELHYINNVLMFKTGYGLSGVARGLNLLSNPSTTYFNNIILTNNNKTLLNINMKKLYKNYLNDSVSTIPNFFLMPWKDNTLDNSFIKKNIQK